MPLPNRAGGGQSPSHSNVIHKTHKAWRGVKLGRTWVETGRQRCTRMRARHLSTLRRTEGVHQHLNTYKVLNPHIRADTIWIVVMKTAGLLSSNHSRQVEENSCLYLFWLKSSSSMPTIFSTASHIHITPPLYGVYISFMALAGQFYLWVCNLNYSQKHIYLTEMSWCPCIIFQLHFELIGLCIGSTYISK